MPFLSTWVRKVNRKIMGLKNDTITPVKWPITKSDPTKPIQNILTLQGNKNQRMKATAAWKLINKEKGFNARHDGLMCGYVQP